MRDTQPGRLKKLNKLKICYFSGLAMGKRQRAKGETDY